MPYTFGEDSKGRVGAVRSTADGNQFFVPIVSFLTDGVTPVYMLGTIRDAWNGSTNTTRSFAAKMTGLVIHNDGDEDVTFTVGSITHRVAPGEKFEGKFEPFNSISIMASSPYRAYVMS